MAKSQTALIRVLFSGALTDAQDFANPSVNWAEAWEQAFANGAGAAAAERCFLDERTIAASGSEELNLNDGSLVDPLGGTLAFTGIKAIALQAAAANTNNVVVGNASATQFLGPLGAAAHTYTITPGGVWVAHAPSAAGWPVSGTVKLLKLANSGAGTGVTFRLGLLGKIS